MLPVGLVLAFVGEVCLYMAICVCLWRVTIAGAPTGPIVVVLFTAYVFIRISVVLLEFAGAYVWRSSRSPRTSIGFWRGLVMVITEVFVFLIVSCVFLPWSRRLLMRRRGTFSTSSQTPVIFIHGYTAKPGVWLPMLRYLRRHGLSNLFTARFHTKRGDIDGFAGQLAAQVNRICETTRAQRVVLVGHSMGGLVARTYAARCGGAERVAKIVSIGAPHHGTRLACFVPGRIPKQMRLGSAWLRDLNRDENRPSSVEHVSIYSTHDNIVVPQNSAEFGPARNVQVVGKGHYTLIFSREVAHIVHREIAET